MTRLCRSSLEDKKGRVWKSAVEQGEEDPFFVVTKTDLLLAPSETCNISLGLTPLVEGEVEILGVRCQLFHEVWIYHAFATDNARSRSLFVNDNTNQGEYNRRHLSISNNLFEPSAGRR